MTYTFRTEEIFSVVAAVWDHRYPACCVVHRGARVSHVYSHHALCLGVSEAPRRCDAGRLQFT